MTFVDVLIATLKTNPCFESKVNVCYGVAMFRLLLLISCLGFVVGCGECTEVEPTVVEPTVVEPTVMEPTVVEPTVVEPRVWVGDATEDDLDMLIAGLYTEITGNLIITESETNTITLSLPLLQSVGGNVYIYDNPHLTTIDLPQLLSVGGYVNIASNATLTTVTLPKLQTVGGLPKLQSVGGYVNIASNATLTTVTLPQLQSVGKT